MEPKKLYTDLAYTSKMNTEGTPPCNHFSLRGYVAEMRQTNGSETQSSLPPLVVERFRSWSCNVCRGENVYNMGERSYHRTCCRRIQETVTDSAREVIDLTADTDDERESDHIPIHEGEKNVAEVSINEITDLVPDMENVGSVCPSLIQSMQTNERGVEGNVACESEAELVVNNVTTEDQSCSKVVDKGKQICEDNQGRQELRKSCGLTGKALVITEKDIVPEHTAERFPQEPVTEDNVHAGNSDNNAENDNDIQDLQAKQSSRLRRVRLLREILEENGEPTAQQKRGGRQKSQNPESECVDSQRGKTVMDNVVGEGDTEKWEKRGQPARKRKLVLEEDEDDAALSNSIQRAEDRVSQMHMSVYSVSPLAQVAPNEEGLEEGLHLSSNTSPQTLLTPIQEGTGETDPTGEQRFSLTSAFPREGRGVRNEETDEATERNELEALLALMQISQPNMVNETEAESQIKQLKEMNFPSTDREIGRGVSMDLNVATGGSDPILQNPNPGECSKTKMDIIGSSQTYGSLKGKLSGKSHAPAICGGNFNGPSAQKEEETPTQHCGDTRATPVSLNNNNISESFCETNRNPADFTAFEERNPYMREKKDEKRKRVSGAKRCGSSSKPNKKPKK